MEKTLFAYKLKELRLEKGIKQDELALIFNVRPATISRWENGKIEPDYLTLIKLAKYFNVSCDILLGIEE